MGEDIIDIIDRINTTLSNIDGMGIAPKFKGDKLYSKEFNSVVNKIEEIKTHLNSPIKETFVDTTAYLLSKIDKARENLNAKTIMLDEDSTLSIYNEIESIRDRLSRNEIKSSENATDILTINSSLDGIRVSLGLVEEKIETSYNESKEYADTVAETAYERAVESSKEYTDTVAETAYERAVESSKEYTDESYTKIYTHINDTTLTFDYDIKTDPEPAEPKIIYDNENDLYDGEYHD